MEYFLYQPALGVSSEPTNVSPVLFLRDGQLANQSGGEDRTGRPNYYWNRGRACFAQALLPCARPITAHIGDDLTGSSPTVRFPYPNDFKV